MPGVVDHDVLEEVLAHECVLGPAAPVALLDTEIPDVVAPEVSCVRRSTFRPVAPRPRMRCKLHRKSRNAHLGLVATGRVDGVLRATTPMRLRLGLDVASLTR